ncbi:MAG: flagellar biosynthesis protein FlhF [Planctomycetaceae bacterium]|nr:flagellar biosynthesis protein FlhF [Planctomycetaceae bacterium]
MSQTDVRTFKAASMHEAIETVRREMGPDAVILQTRELPKPRFFRWKDSSERVEVTAGLGVNVRTPRALQTGMAQSGVATAERPLDSNLAPPPALLASPRVGAALENGVHQQPYEPFLRSAATSATPCAPLPSALPQTRVSAGGPPVLTDQQASIARQLSSIQQMVAQLTREAASRGDEIPSELFSVYTELIDAEVDEDLSRDLIRRLKQDSAADELPDPAAVKARLQKMVESEIRCSKPIGTTPGKRRVVALIGPTGVGKTTTIAKLAANFRLRDGIRLGLVTVDTYRIAAVEQLRTYAEIIDLPMKVVTSPREMRRALDELSGLDLVLIDTAGRSPRDELKIQELKSLLAEAQVDEVHLVLSMVASAKSLEATAEKFAPAGPTSVILTKLDEAVGMGSLLSVARRVPLPVSYLTTGQDVPDDIEHAQARWISRLVLGEESVFTRHRATT